MDLYQIPEQALDHLPKGPKLFFFRKLRKDEKRGARVPFKRRGDREPHEREAFVFLTSVDAGPEYADLLSYSIKDFSRGAYEGSPDVESKKPFFSALSDYLAAVEMKRACRNDPAFHRLMINPIDGEAIISKAWCRRYMGEVQKAIGTRLFWFAAIHHHPTMLKDKNRHVHFLIRGQGLNGEAIDFNANFARYGFWTIATRMITDALGPLTEDEQARRVIERKEMAERRAEIKFQRMIEQMRKKGVAECLLESMTRWQA